MLVPLYEGADGRLHAVFTKRRDDLRRHAGEISFPGGRQDEGETLDRTALREAEEEIGLTTAAVTLAGALPPVGTFVTGYRVYPFVGAIERPERWLPQAAEVDLVLEFALEDLARGYEKRRLVRRGVPIRTDTYVIGEHMVWGATARIVAELLARLAPLGQ